MMHFNILWNRIAKQIGAEGMKKIREAQEEHKRIAAHKATGTLVDCQFRNNEPFLQKNQGRDFAIYFSKLQLRLGKPTKFDRVVT